MSPKQKQHWDRLGLEVDRRSDGLRRETAGVEWDPEALDRVKSTGEMREVSDAAAIARKAKIGL